VVALGCLSGMAPSGLLASVSLAAQPNPVAAAAHAQGAHASVSQKECAATSKALYGQAEALSKRTKQIIPREFARVAANLDDYCDGEDFDKARISIDWMNICLKNFTKNSNLGFCSRSNGYFCALDPQSDACPQGH
jgi:hypothetical protein